MRDWGLGTGDWGWQIRARLVSACVFALFALFAPVAIAAPFTFENIEFWVGTGVNRAGLVIDGQENAPDPPALVWGYRWDGTATGAQMLTDILVADDRFFAKLGGTPANPTAVYGLGYDADNDRLFGLNDGTAFDAAGIAFTDPADLAVATDPADYYAEGWYTGFWHYGVALMNPYNGGAWSDTPKGMAGRMLTDGAWDSWTFSPTFNFAAFAANPQAAASPYPLGDYDHSGVVDAGDYHHWKQRFGSTMDPSADGNHNGIVDAADYTVWRNQRANNTKASGNGALVVPEPVSLGLAIVALLVYQLRKRGTLICTNPR
ncbi:MAG: hypothetical protein WD669_08460 [Pirellulales bacterium]